MLCSCLLILQQRTKYKDQSTKFRSFRIVHLHSIRFIHSVLHSLDRYYPIAARKSRCGRALFEQSLEHSFWSTWYRELVGKDYDWCRGSIHARRLDAVVADIDWVAFSSAIESRECSDFDSDPVADATTVTRGNHSTGNGASCVTVC